jgi:hypothetical protein
MTKAGSTSPPILHLDKDSLIQSTYYGLGRPEPMIKFSSEAVTDKVQSGLGFIGENEEVMRSLSLNCNIAALPREP